MRLVCECVGDFPMIVTPDGSWCYEAAWRHIAFNTYQLNSNKSFNVCNKTNLMHYLSSVYWVTTPLHVSVFLAAYHQKVTMYICNNLYVLYWNVDCLKLLKYLHVIIKCEAHSCYLNLLNDI
jgi:hypothetical protein